MKSTPTTFPRNLRYTERYYSIQVLRAIAALSVILYHVGLLPIGYAGVDLFFVISGFIMGTIGKSENVSYFALKRIVRIVPLYWLVTAIMCALSTSTHLFHRFHFDEQSLLKSLFFIPYYDWTGHIWPLVVPGWTLDYEVFFYAIFAIGLFVGRPGETTVAIISISVVVGMLIHNSSAPFRTYTNPLLLEFIAGLTLSQCKNGYGKLAAYGVITAGLLWLLLFSRAHTFPNSFLRILYLGTPATAIVAGAVWLEREGQWIRVKALEFIGNASYSIYLAQGLSISFVQKFVSHGRAVEALSAISTSIVIGLLSYRFFEKPVMLILGRSLHGKLGSEQKQSAT